MIEHACDCGQALRSRQELAETHSVCPACGVWTHVPRAPDVQLERAAASKVESILDIGAASLLGALGGGTLDLAVAAPLSRFVYGTGASPIAIGTGPLANWVSRGVFMIVVLCTTVGGATLGGLGGLLGALVMLGSRERNRAAAAPAIAHARSRYNGLPPA